jgi:hypothetical protein
MIQEVEGKRGEGERNERGDRGKMLVGLAVDVGDAAAGLVRFHAFTLGHGACREAYERGGSCGVWR